MHRQSAIRSDDGTPSAAGRSSPPSTANRGRHAPPTLREPSIHRRREPTTAPLSDLGGEYGAKSVPPEPDGLVADVDPALGQQILDVAQRQRVSHVHHHDQTDDLWRAVEISERVAHGPILPRPETPRALGLTKPPASPKCR